MLPSDGVSLQIVIDATRRLDELGTARLLAEAAELVHKAQTGGKPLGTLSVDAVVVLPSGEVRLAPGTAPVRGYVAPERLRGGAGDRRSDVFALGVILWEALAHARLFTGDDAAVERAVLAGGVTAPSQHNANIPAELDAICKRALAADPVDRYQSAKVMAAEIAAVLDDAGYPEDNARIASYLATDFTPAPPLVPQPPVLPVADTPSRPTNQTLHGMPPVREVEPAKPAPSLATASPTQTLQGVMPRKEIDAALAQRAATADARPTTKTAIMGSIPSTEALPAPATEASAPVRKKRDSLAERLAALNGVPAVPGLPAVPPGADPAVVAATPEEATPTAPASTPPSAPTVAPGVPPTIANAETQATPALADAAAPALTAPAVTAPLEAATPVEPPAPDPAAVVALPRPRSQTDGGGGKADPLQGWGWKDGHDTEAALEDAYFSEDEGATAKKRLVLAIGGAAAAVVLIVVAALAFGGSSDERAATAQKPTTSAGSVDWSAPTEPAPTEPAPTEPAPTAAAAEPPAGSADDATAPVTPAPAPVTPAPELTAAAASATVAVAPAPAPAAVAPPAPAPAKVATPTPSPAKVAATPPAPVKPEPRKAEPVKVAKAVAKPAPKRAPVDPFAAPSPSRVSRQREAPKPIDPYAAPEPKKASVDPNAAYKAGIQQFARGDANGALATFKASLAANPGFAPTWRGIGMVYEKLGKKSQAKTAFRKYLQLSPRAGDAAQIRERMERL